MRDKRPSSLPDAPGGRDHGRKHGAQGFTLLEILVVVAILGLLIGLVAPAALRQLGGAKTRIAKQSIERLGAVLDLYKLDVGAYPDTEQGLAALAAPPQGVANWSGPYLKSGAVPLDPWNHPFSYRMPSARTGYEYDLCSPGPAANGAADTETAAEGRICN